MKLKSSTVSQFSDRLSIPRYDKKELSSGIVHIGVGGFHRAHQAVYTDGLLQNPDHKHWAICGVGLRQSDRAMQRALDDQDFLYSVIELGYDDKNTVTVIGAINEFLFAPDDPDSVITKLASAEVKIVSLTITEGGYNVDDNTGLFNFENPDVIHDLQNHSLPRTVFGYLCEALVRRKQKNIAPFTVMSCDNLPHNGDVARLALLSFAKRRDKTLAEWVEQNVTFPNSMVDRITPITNQDHKQWLHQTHNLEDQWPVVCEPFTQWVLEDNFCNGRPPWEDVGAEFTHDVTPFELVKIRLLNASHMAMAYLGFLAGFRYTHEILEDAIFSSFIRDFMDLDVTPILSTIKEIDITAYKDVLMQRFANRQIGDQLARLCLDGSSKMPKFIVPTVHQLIESRAPMERVALIIAGWAIYLRGIDENGNSYLIDDPNSETLQAAVRDKDSITQEFLNLSEIFGTELINSPRFSHAYEHALIQLETKGVMATIRTLSKG